MYGRLTSKKIIYHLHEISSNFILVDFLLTKIIQSTANKIIYVSKSHRELYKIKNVSNVIIPNSLSDEFFKKASSCSYSPYTKGDFNVFLISSLRKYKGIYEYLELIEYMQNDINIKFHLQLSESNDYVEKSQI